jgi:hypothetical protein
MGPVPQRVLGKLPAQYNIYIIYILNVKADHVKIVIESPFLSQKKTFHYKVNRFRYIIPVYWRNNTKSTGTLCGSVWSLNVKAGGIYNNHWTSKGQRLLYLVNYDK